MLRKASVLALIFSLAAAAGGQDSALDRVRSEAAALRDAEQSEPRAFDQIKAIRDRSAAFHAALRDWIESLVPKSGDALAADLSSLSPRVDAELRLYKLLAPDGDFDNFKPGFVDHVKLSLPPEDREKLAVVVGIALPCGYDDAVYVYDYSRGSPQRVLESHGARDHDESISAVSFSKRDAIGNQLILTLRYAVQCGSSWNRLSYDAFRLSNSTAVAMPVLSGEHGIWFGAEHPYQLRLEGDDLLLEIRDRSIDAGIHNRAHVLHYRVSDSSADRIDPVALQPQDFVDEWLTRPWTEMASRSAERDGLKKWHDFFYGDFVAGEFSVVQQCADPEKWLVGVDLSDSGGKELPKTLSTYFLVQQFDRFGFRMIDIDFDPPDGGPGDSAPSDARPSLFPAGDEKR